MATNQTIQPQSTDAGISPFAFQHYARDYYEAYKSYNPKVNFSPAKLFLISQSIELAAKGLHLDQNPAVDLRGINHDLEGACDPAILQAYGIILTTNEMAELKKANAY